MQLGGFHLLSLIHLYVIMKFGLYFLPLINLKIIKKIFKLNIKSISIILHFTNLLYNLRL